MQQEYIGAFTYRQVLDISRVFFGLKMILETTCAIKVTLE